MLPGSIIAMLPDRDSGDEKKIRDIKKASGLNQTLQKLTIYLRSYSILREDNGTCNYADKKYCHYYSVNINPVFFG
jgi:hypothetical protein